AGHQRAAALVMPSTRLGVVVGLLLAILLALIVVVMVQSASQINQATSAGALAAERGALSTATRQAV
ncbi:MAG: hypothetical protein JWP48_3920, partial [Actinoallomurus sp.]|nr:hypothetical protein [Actinoallomurus sp.]